MTDLLTRVAELEEGVNRFVAENATPRDLEDLRRRYGRREIGAFLEFCEKECGGVRFFEAQIRIAEAILHRDRVAVQSNNGLGKDFVAAHFALWWTLCVGGYSVILGATERTVRQATMRYLRRAFFAGNLPGQLYELSLRLNGEDRLLAFASNSVDRTQGLHDRDMLVVVTEAQGVEDFVYEAVDALTTGGTAKVVLLGNPLRPQGRFYEACTGGQWFTIALSAWDHPNVAEGRELYPGAVTRQWVEHMKATYGEDSPVYIARVLGRFPENAINGLVQREWLETAAQHWEKRTFERAAADARPVLALDVARYGADSCALAVVQGPVVREVTSWRGTDLVTSARRFKAAGQAHTDYDGRRPIMVVDALGVGGGVADNLKDWGWRVEEFHAWSPARDTKRFMNQRAESYFMLREALRNGRVALPRDPQLFQELLSTTWFLNTRGQIQLEGKDDIREELGRSPDLADAVSMAFYHANAPTGRVEVIRWRV